MNKIQITVAQAKRIINEFYVQNAFVNYLKISSSLSQASVIPLHVTTQWTISETPIRNIISVTDSVQKRIQRNTLSLQTCYRTQMNTA